MLNLVTASNQGRQEIVHTLDDIAREGARRMLVEALALEVGEYITRNSADRDDNGRALVVRNGKAKPRKITLGSGTVEVAAPRVNDRRPNEKFLSKILPPYMRKSPKVENLLPLLYLKGLSTSDFRSALKDLFGEGTTGLSPSSIVALKKTWEKDFEIWKKRQITDEYAYIWADGVNVSVRLGEDKKLCLLVIVGVSNTGEKHLLAVSSGYRESKDSWKAVLEDLRDRGFKAPLLAMGDGALGFWAAIREANGFKNTVEQRCWVHKIRNVLDKLPRRIQPRAKGLLHEMMRAETKADADKGKNKFVHEFHAKYPKAVDCLTKDWTELTAFFNFPATHWQHIRTTNAIESTFATVRLRTNVTKGAGSPRAAEVMAFKLLEDAQNTWRKIRGYEEIENLLNGIEYKNGVMVPEVNNQAAPAA
jgi:transposase-like protein